MPPPPFFSPQVYKDSATLSGLQTMAYSQGDTGPEMHVRTLWIDDPCQTAQTKKNRKGLIG